MNDLVRFDKQDHEDTVSNKDWHLISEAGDGEGTACGLIYSDYSVSYKSVKRGGVTCKECLGVIEFYKSVKL